MLIEYIHFEKIDSTNTWAKKNIHLFPKLHLTVISADEQTAGRGRMNHQWTSPPNQNIYATFCFWVPLGYVYVGNISQLLAVSCAEMLQSLGFSVGLKWPNDLVTPSKKKLAGILCETVIFDNQVCVMAGIGLNVNMPSELLKTIDKPATSLHVESGQTFDSQYLLKLLGKHFLKDLIILKENGFNPILERYRSLLHCKKGENIQFNTRDVLIEGVFDSIAENGSLNLRLKDKTLRNFLSGEMILETS